MIVAELVGLDRTDTRDVDSYLADWSKRLTVRCRAVGGSYGGLRVLSSMSITLKMISSTCYISSAHCGESCELRSKRRLRRRNKYRTIDPFSSSFKRDLQAHTVNVFFDMVSDLTPLLRIQSSWASYGYSCAFVGRRLAAEGQQPSLLFDIPLFSFPLSLAFSWFLHTLTVIRLHLMIS